VKTFDHLKDELGEFAFPSGFFTLKWLRKNSILILMILRGVLFEKCYRRHPACFSGWWNIARFW